MFFYQDTLPKKGTIVMVQLELKKENEDCFYVTLPEYDNIEGIINKSEFSRKVKRRNKEFVKLRREKLFPCLVVTKPYRNSIIDLSLRDVDTNYKQDIITRFHNIQKILKIIKFISLEYKLDYYDIIDNMYESHIIPLRESNIEDRKIDTYHSMYQQFLLNPLQLINLLDIDVKLKDNINNTLQSRIKEGISSSSLNFDISIWKSEKDGIYALRELFAEIKNRHSNIDLRYIGAPTYQITLKAKICDMDSIYTNILNMIHEWMKNNNVSGYGIRLDVNNKEIKQGDVSISYPYKVCME